MDELRFIKSQIKTKRKNLDLLKPEIFAIKPYSQSINDIPKECTMTQIKSTIEYNKYAQEMYNKIVYKEIDVDTAIKRMDRKINQLKKNKIIKRDKIDVKDIETIKVRKRYKIELTLKDIEHLNLISYNNTSILIPTRDSLIKHLGKIDKKYTYYCFVNLNILGPTLFNGMTRKVPIITTNGKPNEKYNEQILNATKDVLKRLPQYEEDDAEIICGKILITITKAVWQNIDNWYPDKIIKKYKKFNDFTLFTANDKNKNCLIQCVEELGGKWNEKKELIDMIPQKRIITYIPILQDIQYVQSLDDLITDYDNEITNDCKNIARLIKWNNHVGVITEIKEKRRIGRIQKKKEIKVETTEFIEVFFDIEAFTNKDNKQIPYLICWCYNNNNVQNAIGKNCIKEFVKAMINIKKDIILYAWYGSGYDYQHILPYLKEKCIKEKYIIKNNMITYCEMTFKKSMIILKDPFLFILTSLDKAAKTFNVINKGSFPHSIINSWEDLEKVLPKWVTIQQNLIQYKKDDKLNIKIEHVIKETEENYKTIIEKALEYCNIDVLAMKEVWIKFKKLVKENLEIDITTKTFTLSQLSMKLMEASLTKEIKLYVPNKEEYEFIRQSIYGGRVIAKNGIYNEKIVYADVVSLYPSAMRLLKHSYGRPKLVNNIDYEKHGIYDVTLIHKENKEPKHYLEFVPRRIDGKLKWNWFKEHRGKYHTYDLIIAKEEGYNIICHKGIEYPNKDYIFNNFIDKLYSVKEEHSNCTCKEQPCPIRMVAKIALNGGGYGKFVQKPITKEVYIVKRDIVAGECENLIENEYGEICIGKRIVNKPKFYNLDGDMFDKMVIEKDDDPIYSTQCGVSILSGSRYRLFKLCKQFPGIKIIYSDTDSIFVKMNSINWKEFKLKCGDKLGELDSAIDKTDNAIIHKMLIGGPKMYAYEFKNHKKENDIKMYCKGVPKSMLTLDQFLYMLEDKNQIVAYEFEILRKKLISIYTENIIKDIKQTFK